MQKNVRCRRPCGANELQLEGRTHLPYKAVYAHTMVVKIALPLIFMSIKVWGGYHRGPTSAREQAMQPRYLLSARWEKGPEPRAGTKSSTAIGRDSQPGISMTQYRSRRANFPGGNLRATCAANSPGHLESFAR